MKSLEDIKILVVGDIMLDKYIHGEVERISPEAPVPIVHVQKEYCTLGGCGNVVRNIRELGPQVSCLSALGLDENGGKIIRMLSDLEVKPLISTDLNTTITKERIIASERKIQMIRVDREEIRSVNANHLIEILKSDDDQHDYDIIVISDYAKGLITSYLMTYINESGIRYIVDPKPKNLNIYGYPYLITPNEKECLQMGGANNLLYKGSQYVLETKGKRGMKLYDNTQHWEINADEVEVYNVSGAGDTVVAIMAICLSMGWNTLDSAYIANRCASYVVTKPDTSTVPKEKFLSTMSEYMTGK